MMEKCDKCNGTGMCGVKSDAWNQQPQAIGPQVQDAKGPMILTGSVAFAVERDALKAERDRMARELEEARAASVRVLDDHQKLREQKWQQVCESEWFQNLNHYGTARTILSLLQDGEISRGKAAASLVELAHGVTPDLPDPGLPAFADDEIPSEVVASLRAELARMRPVVEAANAWRLRMTPETIGRLLDAIDTYRADAGKERKCDESGNV